MAEIIRKKIMTVILVLAMVISFITAMTLTADAAGEGSPSTSLSGSGTDADPFLITSAADLAYMRNQVNAKGKITPSGGGSVDAWTASYKLTNHIVLGYWQDDGDGVVEDGEIYDSASGGTAYSASNWTPIGLNTKSYFSGTFDGGDHTVSGIYINSSSYYQGLFGLVFDGTVKNVGVKDSYIKGGNYVGGVVGDLKDGAVQDCYNLGRVSGGNYVGGVVGDLKDGAVQDCYNLGSVSGTYYVGGVVGLSRSGTVQYCCNMGSINGTNYVGGVVGYNYRASGTCMVQYCCNTGSVNGTNTVGGVVGINYSGTVQYCYNTGNISGEKSVGGVVGTQRDTLQYCYNTGSVSGTNSVGSIAGTNVNNVTGCYYDKQMCSVGGISDCDYDGKAEGMLTTEMTAGTAFPGWSSGDTGTWNFTSGLYPRLTGYVDGTTDYKMDETDAALISALPVILAPSDTAAGVKSDFTLSTVPGVSWVSSNESVISINGSSASLEGDGSVTLTASLGDFTKSVILKVDKTAPILLSAALDSDTQITVTLSEPCNNLANANDGGFTVTKTGTLTTFAVSGTAQGTDTSQVVLSVADMAEAKVKGVMVTYTAGVNGTITDIAGNPLATNSTGIAISAWAPKLSTPESLSWDTETLAKATWGTVANASKYTVQLYKDGIASGSPVTGITNTYYDFTSVITETGLYTFTVTAIGDDTTYLDSDLSLESPVYSYTAPVIYISTASANITAPAAGASPQATLDVETATSNADYTVSNIVWNEALTAGNRFKAGQVYTATVTLTSKNGKEFQTEAFTPTVVSASSVGTTITAGTGTGNTVTFTVTFTATEAQSVAEIAVKTQPTNMTYTTGETLNLAGLVATITYNDGTTADVALEDFDANNITANPADGTLMAVAAYNGQPVTLTCNTHMATTNPLTVNKADISGITFENSTVTYDGTAKTIQINGTLPEGANVSYSSNTGTNAGTYEATAAITGGPNYNNTTLTATLTINKVTLTAAVGDYSKTYGEENPGFTVVVTGFVNGETADTASGYTSSTASSLATATTGVGSADITISGGTATNYTFNTTDTGTLTITQKALAATAAANNKTYDGTTTTTGTINLAGKVGDDDVTASGSFAFESADAGTGKTVNVTGITLAGSDAGNYTVNESTTTTANIDKAEISGIIFDNSTVTYDGTAKTIQISGTLPEGVTVGYINNTGTDAGTYDATATITGGTNYNNTTLNATLTINKATLTATLVDYSKTYGEENPDFTVAVTGFVNGETADTASGYTAPIASTTATAATGVGSADITISGGAAINYIFDITDTGRLTINKKELIASVGDYSKTYGEENPAFAVEVSGFVNGETADTASGYTAPTASTTAIATTGVGSAEIAISGGAATNYTFDISDTGVLTITQKALAATAAANNKTYDGTTTATGTVNLAGKVGDDDVTASGSFAFESADAGTGKTVNVTEITLAGSDAGNYTVNESITTTANIDKAEISGIIFDNSTVTYDGTAKTIQISGTLPEGASVNYSSNAGTDAGVYEATATITGGTNYNNTTLNATLTINKATLTATLVDYSKTYGEENPDFEVEVSGFVNGEIAATAEGYIAPIANTTATATTGVGTADITISGGAATNYTFNTTDTGVLTINKKELTASVGDYSKTYGEENPAFAVEVTGFVNGETAATASGYTAPIANITATATTGVGSAEITISGGTATNYTFNTTDIGVLTITQKALAATAAANNKTYDKTTTATGTVNLAGKVGDDDVTASGSFAFESADAGTGKTVNVTGITLAGSDAGNYTVNESTTTTANIDKANISGITFENSTVTYDGTTKIIKISGTLPEGATVGYIDNTGTDAGTYDATATITVGTNYNNTTLNATLTINKATLTATLVDYSKTYGEENPDFTVAVTGFVNGETADTASGYTAPIASTTTTATTGVGTADITISGGAAINYIFDITDTGRLTINKKELTASVEDYSKTYGEENPAFAVEVSGFVNGETAATAAGYNAPAASTTAIAITGVGSAEIAISGGAATNYTFDISDKGNLIITKKALTVTAVADNKTYDGTTTATGTINLTGKVGTDDVTASGIFAFESADAGVGKTVNVTGIIQGGNDAGNYTVTESTATTASIDKAEISGITFDNSIVTYDGIAKTIQISGTLPEGASVNYSSNAGTNAGVYEATATITGGTNYNNTTLNATLTINKATLTATLVDYSKTYGEENPDFTVEVIGFVNGETADTASGYTTPIASTTATATTGVGSADITISGGTATNYTFNTTDTGVLTINKKELTVTAIAQGKIYDGTTTTIGTINLTGKVGDDDVTASGSFAFESADAGTGKTVNVTGITLAGSDAGNYTVNESTTTTANIDKANISGITFENSTVTYDGTTKTIQISGTLPEGASVDYTGNTGTNAGTYNAIASITGGNNYNDKTLNATLTITKADITGITFDNATAVYDGTEKKIEITGILPEGANVSYTNNTGTNVGSYSATAIITGGTNYNDLTLNAALTISKADVSGINFYDATYSYDGTEKKIKITDILPEGAGVSYANNTGTNVGTYDATAIITGGTNYNDTTLNATLTISKVTLIAAVGDYSKTYGEDNPAFTVDVTGFVNSETTETAENFTAPTASTMATAESGAGETAITISGGGAINYTFDTSDTGILTINRKALTIKAEVYNKAYDGTTTAQGEIILAGKVGSDEVMADGSFAFESVGAGSGKTVHVTDITLQGADAGNYTIDNSTTGTGNITPKVLTPTASAHDKAYDGTTSTSGTISLLRIVGSDDVTATGTFAFEDALVGKDKTVNVTEIMLGGAQAGNYTLSTTTLTATAEITKEAVSISVTTLPTKSVYEFGEALNTEGGIVTVSYSDNSISTTALTGNMCQVGDTPAIGERVVTVTYLDKTANFNMTYNKAAQATPAAPVCSVTEEGITVTSPVGNEYEYSRDGGANWQTGVSFRDLIHESQYTIITRIRETGTHLVSNASEGTLVTFLDQAGPIIMADMVLRTSHTEATVKFTSNEDGEYYYEVAAEGAAEPQINTGGLGEDCSVGKTTINLTLTPGAKDIYIIVKDGAGNDSNTLRISIPAYVWTDREKAQIDLDDLTWDIIRGQNTSQNRVTDNLNLTVTGLVYGSNISWMSTDTNIISINGMVTRPSFIEGNANVTVTASVYSNEGTDTKKFDLTVLKLPAATNADLSGVLISSITLSPAFSADVTSYSVNVSHGTSSITITPTTKDSTATVRVNGNIPVGGSISVPLNTGNNTISIEVTAQDGSTQKTYTLNISRASGGSNRPPSTLDDEQDSGGTGVDIIVNGKVETAATATTIVVDNKTVTTITVDDKKVEEKLNKEGNNAVVTIPVNKNVDVMVGQLNGQTVKNMETKSAILEIKTENVTYTLPASQVNIDSVSSQIGTQVELRDIKVNVRIAEPPADTVKIVEDTANKNNYQVVVKPVEFEISCTSSDKTVEVSKFNGYVERTVAIPDGIDPSKITTGIVLNADGTFSHVPTTIVFIDGKYYAKINSLTNSTYSVIWNQKEFVDVKGHWAKNDINDMASRLVINGIDANNFEPGRDITRAEFATIIVKALGLMKPGTGKNVFPDINEKDWYKDAIAIAYEYKLVTGYEDNTFRPNQKITREEEMAMLYRAMMITKLDTEVSKSEMVELLESFSDGGKVSVWAKNAVAACINNGIVSGYKNRLMPNDNITRAETAATVRRMLRESDLIN